MSGDIAYCRECGNEIDVRAEICPDCGIRQQSPNEPDMSPGIPAAASFIIPGLGQVVNGQLAKGIILGIVTVSFALTGIGLIVALPIWLWLVYDAYKVAKAE